MIIDQLSPFVAQDKSRSVLCEPFVEDGKTVATDGRILIRTNEVIEFKRVTEVTGPTTKHLFDGYPQSSDWFDLPEFCVADFEKDCDPCGGTGECECQCGHIHKCENCGGTGTVMNRTAGVAIGSCKFSMFYLQKLKSLPGVKVRAMDNHATILAIKFDGGDGLLMGLRE